VVRADDRAHVLRIEPRRHRGRTDEVAEHDGQLAALGLVPLQHGLGGLRLRCGGLARGQLPDRSQHFPAIAEEDAEFLQVPVGKLGKHREIDAVLGEALGIFGHAEPFEPVRDRKAAASHELSSSSTALALAAQSSLGSHAGPG
jgi:hypothetical protein